MSDVNFQGSQGGGNMEPPFAEQSPDLNDWPLDLSSKRENEPFHLPGNFLWAVNSTATGNLMEISFKDSALPSRIPFGKGMYVKGLELEDVLITNESMSEKVTLVYGYIGPTEFDVGNLNEGVNEIKTLPPSTLKTKSDITINSGSQAQVFDIANDPNDRVENVMVTNIPGTGPIRVGDSNVGSAQGDYVAAGATWSRSADDDVYAYNPNGSSLDVTVSWTEKQ